MLEILLGYDQRIWIGKSSYFIMGLYSKDTASKMDLLAVDDGNEGLKARKQYIRESKIV